MDQFNKSTDLLFQRLAEKADGKTEVRMLDEISRLTMDIIAKVWIVTFLADFKIMLPKPFTGPFAPKFHSQHALLFPCVR